MAKNKKKKKINEQYGNGIAPISLQNDKFTIKTPEPKKKTKKEQEEYDKKQKEAAKSLGNAVEYTAKKTGLGAVQGITGFVDAPMQSVQEGARRAQNKSVIDNAKNLIVKNALPGNLGRIPDTMNDISQILADPNKKGWQKAVNAGMELVNSFSLAGKLEDAGQLYGVAQQILGRNAEKDIQKTREVVNKPSEELTKVVEKDRDKLGKAGQIAGDTGQVVGNMIPAITASILTGGAGGSAAAQQTASLFTMGVSAKGQATREAEQRGADLSTANNIGMIKGLTEVLTEKISGGVKLFGKGSVDDIVEKGLNKYIKNKGLNYLAKQGVGVLGENIEEWISDVVGVAIDKATVDPDAKYTFKDWANTGMMTVLSTLALNGLTGGYSRNSYINNATELERANQTENAQKVIESELQSRLATEFKGKATAKEIAKLQAEIIEDMKNGYISTDTIEKTLGGETYNQLNKINEERQNIQAQIDELQQKADNNELSSLEEKQKLNDLKEQIKTIDDTEIRNQLNQEIQETIKNDIGLQESYREIGRRTENYKVDLDSIQDEKQRAVYQKAMDSGVLNNSNKTHALVDMIAKISSEKGINFDFTNNEQLEKSGFGVNGRNINGYVTDSGITINLNSGKAINRIVGHELTHTFEGTTLYTELQDSLKDFLGSEWDNQLERYKELYKGVKNANIENELTSDLIGDYLFTDENYVRDLSTKHKNVFEKIYDEIKYLYNVATAGSKEKRQLAKVKRTFDRIYNETESKVTTEENAKLSLSKSQQKYLEKTNNNEKLKEKEFYSLYSAHKIANTEKAPEIIKSIQENGFKPSTYSYGVNLTPTNHTYIDGKPDINDTYAPKKGDYVLFVPENEVRENPYSIKPGYKPREFEAVQVERDYQPYYELYEKAYDKYMNNKTKYSISEDSQGRELTENQKKYFKNSKVVDDNGNLKVMYNGGGDYTTFDNTKMSDQSKWGKGIYLTEDPDIANMYGNNVKEVYVDIENPINQTEKTISFDKYNKLVQELYDEEADRYDYDVYDNDLDLLWNVTNKGNWADYGEQLRNIVGVDGLIIEDSNPAERMVIAFNSNQIKNVSNENPTSNADIRYDLSVSEANTTKDNEGRKLSKDQLSYFKDTKAVDNDGNLITVYHTTTNAIPQFNEFNPVGTEGYRYGDQVVNFYTNSKTMSGSYADYEYQMADTSKLNNLQEAKEWLKKQNTVISKFGVSGSEQTGYYLTHNDTNVKSFKTKTELLKNIKNDFYDYFNNITGTTKGIYKYQYEGYVNITNPYIIDAKEANWDSILTGYDEMSVRYANEISQEDKQELIELAKDSKQKMNEMYDELKSLYSESSDITMIDARPEYKKQMIKEAKKKGISLAEQKEQRQKEIDKKIDEIKSKQHYEDDYFKENVSELQDKINNELNMNYSDYDLYKMANTEFEEDNLKRIFGRTESTNDIVKYVLDKNKQGANYDGVIIKNVLDYGSTIEFDDNGAAQDVYVTFNSNQFKAADNTNPTADPDIRYSLSMDSQGRELSEGQQEYFRDSKVRDENGNLMPVYHASRGHQFTVFDKNKGYNIDAFYFTKDSNVASHWSKNGEYVVSDESYNSIKNQINNAKNYQELIDIVNSNNFGYKLSIENGRIEQVYDGGAETSSPMKSFDKLKQDVEYNLMSQKYSGDIYKEYLNITNPLVVDAKNQPYHSVEFEGKKLNTETIASIAKERGYDGVIVKNVYETDYENRLTDDYIAFNSNQVKNIDNLNPTENDDIRYSLDIAPISKNFLTEAEQDELDGLRAVENSGFSELTPEEQSRMYELENRANTILNKKAEKMLRSASYKAINTTTKIADNYLDFDAKQKKEFRSQMREFSNMTKDELVNADTYNKVKDIVSQYANKEYTYFDDSVESLKRELKHTKIQVSDELKNQITDYGDFVKDSKLMLRRNSGQSVDKVYKEYSDMYPGFFSNDVWNEEEQLEALNDFVNHDFSVTEKYKLTDEDLRNATDLIYNKLLDNSLTQQDLIETEEILDKKAQKRTRSVVREELLQKMGITPETIQVGNDISAISFARTDPIRVNEKVFGWETGQKINDATVNFTKHQEAERMRFLNKERQEIKDLGIKARSKESELVQKYGEKQYVDKNNEVHEYGDAELARDVQDAATREKIKNAARVLRQKYDTYIDRVNSVLTEMGYDEIPKRKDYMRHFVELDDKFSRWGLPFNKESMSAEDLPTDINGLTEFNRPGKSYFASANTRTGLQTTYDAITGIDGYLEGVSNLIYHTESIQRYRALSRFIRENYGREHGFDNIDLMTDEELADRIKDIQDNKLSKYVSWLDEQANSIAGKKGALDRSVERMFGRRIYTALNTLKSQVGSNMTGFNVRSAMTNFASAIQGASKTQKLAFVKGTVSTLNNIIHDDGMIEKSDFLTRRLLNTDSLAMKPWQKLTQAGQVFMNGTDYFTANQIWRSKYFENLDKGMSETQAIKNADDFAARIMGDRSKGSTAELFNSKTLGFLSQFQLEVNNQWSSLIHDNKIDIQKGDKTALGVTFELGQLFAASYMFNTMMKSLTGSDVMIDPIDMLLKIFRPDDRDKDKSIVERAQEVLGEFINQLPFANLVTGGGRIPISEAFTGVSTLGKKLTGGTDNYGNEISWGDVKDDLTESLAYWVLPTGYGQIRKTVKGLSMYDDKLPVAGSYTDSGNLRFSAEDTPFGRVKAGLFGQYSSKYAQDYIDSGYKSINASKLDEMKDLDMNSTEYRNYREGLSEAGTSIEDKLDYINSLDVPYADKDIMASNVAKKDIDMKEYNKYGSYEEFNYAQKNPAKYQVMKYIGGYDTYKNYEKEINDIKADYDRNGKAITNSRKNKVIKYVNSLNLTKAQKAMLIKEQYPSFTKYDKEIASYINSQNIRYIEKASILKQLGFTAYDRQIINYIRQNYRTVEEQQEELEKLGFKVYNYNGKTYVR